MTRDVWLAAWALALLFSLPACQGARTKVRFGNAAFPISMSSVIPGPDGKFLTSHELRDVGRFLVECRGWGVFWSLVSLNSPDLSEEINSQVAAAGGDGVIDLRISSATPWFPDVLPGWLFLHWLPIWPGSVDIRVEGVIVRLEATKTAERE